MTKLETGPVSLRLEEAEKFIAALAFIYDEPNAAIESMHLNGDKVSAQLFRKIEASFATGNSVLDISHSAGAAQITCHLTIPRTLSSVTRLIEAYDELREQARGQARPQLRETLQIWFDLRDCLRQPNLVSHSTERLDSSWLDAPIGSFPATTATVNKLKKAGFTTLRQIHGAASSLICGLTGISTKQLGAFDEAVWRFLCASNSSIERLVRQRLELALTESWCATVTVKENWSLAFASNWTDQKRRDAWENLADYHTGQITSEFPDLRHIVSGTRTLRSAPADLTAIENELKDKSRPRLFAWVNAELEAFGVNSAADLLRISEALRDQLFRRAIEWDNAQRPEPQVEGSLSDIFKLSGESRETALLKHEASTKARHEWLLNTPPYLSKYDLIRLFEVSVQRIVAESGLDLSLLTRLLRSIDSPLELTLLGPAE
jgi:hypothetical protein